jgi:hypothetical protein
MAVGDSTDISNRLINNLPNWFGTNHPNLDAILQAFNGSAPNNITTTYFHYQQYQYVLAQTRLQTATGNNLDLISQDYLGTFLPRKAGENDDTYRQRIKAFLLLPRATRTAMSNAILLLTGYTPLIIEPFDGSQGYYNVPQTLAYNTFGAYGSFSYPYQAWIYVYLYTYQGMSNYPGYDLLSYVSVAAVNAGGSGYAIGDTITMASDANQNPVIVTVVTLSGSAVATVSITNAGIYNTIPSNPVPQGFSSGSGTGASFNFTWSAYTPYLNYDQVANSLGLGFYGGLSLETIDVSEDDVLALIQAVKCEGTLMHVFFIFRTDPPKFPY